MVALTQRPRPGIALTDPDRDAAIDAMRIAAEKRTEGSPATGVASHLGRSWRERVRAWVYSCEPELSVA
jgi:gluconate kinase